MSLLKHVGTIGSLTMVSRVAGMAREADGILRGRLSGINTSILSGGGPDPGGVSVRGSDVAAIPAMKA